MKRVMASPHLATAAATAASLQSPRGKKPWAMSGKSMVSVVGQRARSDLYLCALTSRHWGGGGSAKAWVGRVRTGCPPHNRGRCRCRPAMQRVIWRLTRDGVCARGGWGGGWHLAGHEEEWARDARDKVVDAALQH